MAITFGIRVVAFADIAAYILRKNIYRAGKVLGRLYKLFGNEGLDRLNDETFKFVLFSSFPTQELAVGAKLFQATDRISTEFMFSNFEYHLRVTEEGESRWDSAEFKKLIDFNVQKIFIVGPDALETSVRESLLRLGFKESQLFNL